MDNGQVIIKGKGNIKIKDLDKGILRVRYSNNRKLTNNVLQKTIIKLVKEWLML